MVVLAKWVASPVTALVSDSETVCSVNEVSADWWRSRFAGPGRAGSFNPISIVMSVSIHTGRRGIAVEWH